MNIINLKNIFDNSQYNRFNIYRELWKKTESYELLTNFPLHLDIELSGVCNLKCNFCFQNGLIQEPLGLMEFDLFKKIINEGVNKGLCAIKLQVRGESFLNPKLFECISYAKQKGILDIQLTTNSTFLSEENINKLLESELDVIRLYP
ncbi:radical SAM additional 4Fe4S-binding domain-containing protein, partial [Candidatus Magnetomorum sp. HK-1]